MLSTKGSLGVMCAGVLALSGCASGVEVYSPNATGQSGTGAAAGASGSAPVEPDAGIFDSADGSVIPITAVVDGASAMDDKPGACGASSLAAQSVVVEQQVSVTTEVVTQKPVALYIMLDRSYSMSQSNLWKPAVSALKSFIGADASKGLGVGLQFFPMSSGGTCSTGAGYDTPNVPVGPLPDQANAFNAALDAFGPSFLDIPKGTPMEGALRGVTNFCLSRQAAHPEEQCVAVLVTDGKPEIAANCNEDGDALAAIAKQAHDAGVITFAVGLKGADFGLLDKIAAQGGAPDCDPNSAAYACDVSSGAEKLGDALNSIRDQIVTTEVHPMTVTHVEQTPLPCEWAIPAMANDGVGFDPDKVNIQFSAAGSSTTLVRAGSLESCRADAWYFDDPTAPTRFIACPALCEQIKAASDAKIDVLLGCATRLPE